MKKISAFLFLVAFLNTTLYLHAQNNAFSVKKKQAVSSRAVPQAVLPFNSVKRRIPGNQPVFQPLQASFNSMKLDRQVFSNPCFNASGSLIFVEGKLPATSKSASISKSEEEECNEYLSALQQAMGISDPSSEFEIVKSSSDELGMQHIKLAQKFKGIPVYGSEIYLHKHMGIIDVFNGNSYPTPQLNSVVPVLAETFAIQSAIAHLLLRTPFRELLPEEKAFLGYSGPETELVIYHKNDRIESEKLTWHITLRPNLVERWEYFIDAQTGGTIHYYNNTQSDGDVTATGLDLNGVSRSFHAYLQSGTYYLLDISRPMYNAQNESGVISTYDAGNTSIGANFSASLVTSSNNTWPAKAVSAHYTASATYEYYKNTHGWNSINNQGCDIPLIINITNEDGSSMENAFWNGVAAFFGNGGSTFKPLAGGFDVGAHELGHAVVGNSANLEYQNQSGALNESFADISGAMLDRDDWKIGEDVIKANVAAFPTGALRDMSNPHNGGSGINSPSWQPAHMNEIYTGQEDNGGVHVNSGIPNLAYYLYANQVSREKAEKVFYRALFNYLTRSSKFIDLRLTVIQSAKDLYGNNSPEVTAAVSAFDQVGITNGSATNVENQLPLNPGIDYILLLNTDPADQNTLYRSATDASVFTPLSATAVNSRPSVIDDGSNALFIAGDKTIHAISLSPSYEENEIQNEPIWGNVAISKGGTMLAAVTFEQDSCIWVYSYTKQQWAKFHLYNPGTQTGIQTDNVLYADALEWTYDGQYIMYDAYNQFNNNSGQPTDYWDVSFLKVWDNAADDWADGSIFKMFTNLPEGVSIGNPSFAKNSPYIAAFDYIDNTANEVTILAVNLETGEVGEVFNNGDMLGYPNYSKTDDRLLFNSSVTSGDVVGVIPMQPDKIHPAGDATSLVLGAKWGVWYAQGTRSLGLAEISEKNIIRVYPNPISDKAVIDLSGLNPDEGLIELFDINGRKLLSQTYAANQAKIEIDLSAFDQGVYLLKVIGRKTTATVKVIKN